MEDGSWIKMMKSLKRISLATLLLPILVSQIGDAEKDPYFQNLKKVIREEIPIIQEQPLVNNARIHLNNLKIPEIEQTPPPYYWKYYEKISSLIDHLGEKGFWLYDLLQDPRFKIYKGKRFKPPTVKPPTGKKSLTIERYKKRIGYEYKKNNISGFINKNINQLELSEETYGISKYITSATIGIESDFGINKGSFNPFNAYFSMYANNYKKGFAKTQLEELLIFCEKNKIDIFSLKSSYAGAISYAQFLPYSLNKWFIGSNLYDMDNNILSAANYLSHFKEETGSLEEAIFKYNESKLYVRAVLDLAKDAEEISQKANLKDL